MGELLKPRVLTKEHAKQKLDADVAEANARYLRRIKEIEARETEMFRLKKLGQEPKIPIRARNGIKGLLATHKLNGFGRVVVDHWPSNSEITPEAASRFTAAELLEIPNLGHKAINGLAVWLHFHGYELKP